MRRYHVTIPQGARQVEEVVYIQDDDAPGTGTVGFMSMMKLLQLVLDQPALLRHANDCPTEVKVSYNGAAWVIEARCITTVTNDDTASGSAPRQ